MLTKSHPKNPTNFCCEICRYNTVIKKDYQKHLLTAKHNLLTNGNNQLTKSPNMINEFKCTKCNKIYLSRVGLWKHTKICSEENDTNSKIFVADSVSNPTTELILLLIKDNSEMKNMMIEQQNKMFEQQSKMIDQQNIVLEIAKNGTHNTITTHTNSHNKAFNLNFFLNETCKDAMNIMDFVESIQLQLSDLERVGEKGYIEGISNIIIKNLKDLDITQRPVHCTDKKRETIYVKDDNKWEKDNANTKMHKMIRKVQDKNFRMVKKFKEKYPDYHKPSSKQSDVYNNIIIESMGGRGDNDYEKEEKIIKRISKEVFVDK